METCWYTPFEVRCILRGIQLDVKDAKEIRSIARRCDSQKDKDYWRRYAKLVVLNARENLNKVQAALQVAS